MAQSTYSAGTMQNASRGAAVMLTVPRDPYSGGFGMVIEDMILTRVIEGSIAAKYGAVELIGRRITHINDIPAYDNNDVARITESAGEAIFRFAAVTESTQFGIPRGTRTYSGALSEQQLPTLLDQSDSASRSSNSVGGPAAHQAPAASPRGASGHPGTRDLFLQLRRRDPSVSLGLLLREPGLTVERVDPNTPAEAAGLHRLIGHQLTHVAGRQVVTVSHVSDASQGLRDIELRLKPKICGVRLRRALGETWGFGVDSSTLVVADVMPDGPGSRAGLGDWTGHRITHVDGKYSATGEQLMATLRRKEARELELRFCPWSVQEVSSLPNTQPKVEEADVYMGESAMLGIGLTPAMVVNDVEPGTSGGDAQLDDYVGWRLTHVNGNVVLKPSEIGTYVKGVRVVTLRFQELIKDSVQSPDELAAENLNIQKYREWLERRSAHRDYAKQPSDNSEFADHRSQRYSRLRGPYLSTIPATFLTSHGKIF